MSLIATFDTARGPIKVELYPEKAPLTVANFVNLAQRIYDLHGGSYGVVHVVAYIVSGIGFLGAGAILARGEVVRGLTTAASVWSNSPTWFSIR